MKKDWLSWCLSFSLLAAYREAVDLAFEARGFTPGEFHHPPSKTRHKYPVPPSQPPEAAEAAVGKSVGCRAVAFLGGG